MMNPLTHAPRTPAEEAARQRRLDSALVFIFTVAIALATIPQRSGYPLADAVEYLKNASRAESGQSMMQNTVRPFFFSAVLSVIFRVTRIFGSTDGREVIAIATVLMLTISGLAAVATYRFVEHLAGARAALGAALFLSANRIFQFWAPTIATDIPCALCIAGAAALAMRNPTIYTSLAIGAAMGFGILFKYQAMMPVGLILVCLPFLWRASGWKRTTLFMFAVFAGIASGLLVQSTLDWIGGRGFGSTLWGYILNNVVYPYSARFAPLLFAIFGKENYEAWLKDQLGYTSQIDRWQRADTTEMAARIPQPYNWYWSELPQFLTWFEFILFCIGVIFLIWRRPRGWWVPFVVLGGCVILMTIKATKEWRLFVCIVPFVFCFIGVGFAAIISILNRYIPRLAPFAAVLGLAPNLVTMLGGVPLQTDLSRIPSVRPFMAYDAKTPVKIVGDTTYYKGWRPWQVIPICMNPSDFGGYERAAQWLNKNAPAGARISATWFWQFHFRLRPDLFLVEPLYQADDIYLKLSPEQKEIVRQYLKSLDYFVTHLQALVNIPEVFDLVEREYEIVTSFESTIFDDTLNRILLFKRKPRPTADAQYVRAYSPDEAVSKIRGIPPGETLTFAYANKAGRSRLLELLHCEFDAAELAQGRITLIIHWRIPEGSPSKGDDIFIHTRIRNSKFDVADEKGYKFAYGRITGEKFKPGTVVMQRIPVRPARDLYDFARARKLNETVSLSAWLQIAQITDGTAAFPLAVVKRFERQRDPDSNMVKVAGIDYTPEK
ncbi:MAG: glycosyltransferase family 39 protein [Planctomycetota bacterium]